MLGYRGQQVLTYVETFHRKRGTVPNYTMIADALDMSRADVCHVVRRLERHGYLKRRAVHVRKKRGWREPVIVLVQA